MELTPGFKLSEAGPIPEDWEAVALGDHLEFKNGISKAGHYFGHGSPIVNYMDVFGQPHLSLDRLRGKVSITRDEEKRFSVWRGDVFFTRTSETAEEIGMSAVAMTDRPHVVFSGFVLRGRPISTDLDSAYLGFILRTDQARKQIESRATYTTRALTNGGMLSLTNIARPPLPEQRAIAGALGDIEAWISAAETEAAKLASVKAAAMDALLTPTSRLPGFEGEWVRHRIGDRGVFSKGRGITRAEVRPSGLPAVRYGEIYTRFGTHIRSFYSFVSRETARSALRLRIGDICFAASGETAEEIGKCAALLVDTECYAGGDIIVFSPTADDPTFLGYYLNTLTVAEQKSRLGQGDAVVHIHVNKLANLEVIMPDPVEQRAIAAVLTDIDTALDAARAVVAKARGMKAAAMDALLSGRTRLPLP